MTGHDDNTAVPARLPVVVPMTFIRALLRLAKPGIVLAEALAALAGMVVAVQSLPPVVNTLLCLVTLLAAAAGAAMLNSVLDEERDGKLFRLMERREALALVGKRRTMTLALVLIGGAALVATAFLNWLTAGLITTAVVAYVFPYTLWLKRRSSWGVIPGGLPGALPVLIGSAAITGTIGMASIVLFLVMFLWQPPHFWLLALRYRADYQHAGLPVLPVTHGIHFTRVLIYLFVVSLLPSSAALWGLGFCSAYYGVCALILGSLFLFACHYYLVRRPMPERAFAASIAYLAGLFLVIILDVVLKAGQLS